MVIYCLLTWFPRQTGHFPHIFPPFLWPAPLQAAWGRHFVWVASEGGFSFFSSWWLFFRPIWKKNCTSQIWQSFPQGSRWTKKHLNPLDSCRTHRVSCLVLWLIGKVLYCKWDCKHTSIGKTKMNHNLKPPPNVWKTAEKPRWIIWSPKLPL